MGGQVKQYLEWEGEKEEIRLSGSNYFRGLLGIPAG